MPNKKFSLVIKTVDQLGIVAASKLAKMGSYKRQESSSCSKPVWPQLFTIALHFYLHRTYF